MTDPISPRKRPYTKPVITMVDLATEETVFAACKLPNLGTGANNVGGCNRYSYNYVQTQPCSRHAS
jgi:hypothetical protein